MERSNRRLRLLLVKNGDPTEDGWVLDAVRLIEVPWGRRLAIVRRLSQWVPTYFPDELLFDHVRLKARARNCWVAIDGDAEELIRVARPPRSASSSGSARTPVPTRRTTASDAGRHESWVTPLGGIDMDELVEDFLPDEPNGPDELRPPVGAGYYCKTCYYELRGLTVYRCPECGAGFDPSRPGTYSRVPRSERLQESIGRAVTAIGSVLEPESVRREKSLLRRIDRLEGDNFELRATVAALAELLVGHGLMTQEAIQAQLELSRRRMMPANAKPSVEELARRLERMVDPPPDAVDEQAV